MRRFTQLFVEMDRTKRTSEKVASIARYFREAPAEDAAWALYFLSGRKLKRLIPSAVLHEAIVRVTQLPEWLLSESYESVGDFAETMALLYPDEHNAPSAIALHQLVQERMLRFRTIAEPKRQIELLIQTWSELDPPQRLVFNKLLTGNFRIGVAQTLIIRALANVADISPAVMAQRFAGSWEPTAESFLRLRNGGDNAHPSNQPYPFLLGYPLDIPLEQLGPIDHWQSAWPSAIHHRKDFQTRAWSEPHRATDRLRTRRRMRSSRGAARAHPAVGRWADETQLGVSPPSL